MTQMTATSKSPTPIVDFLDAFLLTFPCIELVKRRAL